MPTQHFTYPGSPAAALEKIRETALEDGWTIDHMASGPLLVSLKRGADTTTFGWSVGFSVVSHDEKKDVTTLVASTDDVAHNADYLSESKEILALFNRVGAKFTLR